jgi:hypothetical protein
MPIKVTCEKCGGVLHAPDDAGGKKGRCPNCQNVLPIPFEGQRPGSTYPLPTGLASTSTVPNPPPGMAFGGNPNTGGLFPSADAKRPVAPPPFGAAARVDSPGHASSTPGLAPGKTSSLSRTSVPFGARSNPASSGVPIAPETGDWRAAASGLRWIQVAVVFFLISILAPCGVSIYAVNGGQALAEKTGTIKLLNLSLLAELRLGAFLIPASLGALCLIVGRLRLGSVPRSSCARGPAKLSALFTLLAVGGFVAFITMLILGMKDGFVPDLEPSALVTKLETPTSTRIVQYLNGTLRSDSDTPGQIQRFGLLGLLVFGKLAELFFGCSLGRIAAATRNPVAAGRVTRCYLYLAMLGALAIFAALAFELYGVNSARDVWGPKWFGMPAGTRTAIVGGTTGVIVLLVTIAYLRMLGGVRRACREAAA